MKILVLNGGSSSFKLWFHDLQEPLPDEAPKPLWQLQTPWHGEPSLDRALPPVLEKLWTGPGAPASGPEQIEAVGHRIVHGGGCRKTALLTPELRSIIAEQAEFAPAHNHFELEAIEAVDRVLGVQTPQFAVFDTAFHSTLPAAAYVYPLPYEFFEKGVRRYGFHGSSYRYATRRAAHLLGRPVESLRLILCHLGSGASLAAVRYGESIDTTMGFTPLEGLMMGARSGSIDPGIIVYLIRHRGYTADQLDRILNRESGLKGVSGLSGDMREILAGAAHGNPRAQLAFDIYVHRLTRELGGMLTVLGGVDAIVFTGGVGENTSLLRERVCAQLSFLGLELDPARNASVGPDADIATPQSKVRVLVIHAQEDWEIARECYRAMQENK